MQIYWDNLGLLKPKDSESFSLYFEIQHLEAFFKHAFKVKIIWRLQIADRSTDQISIKNYVVPNMQNLYMLWQV